MLVSRLRCKHAFHAFRPSVRKHSASRGFCSSHALKRISSSLFKLQTSTKVARAGVKAAVAGALLAGMFWDSRSFLALAAERKFTFQEARDLIVNQLKEFRSVDESAKWPKLRIRHGSGHTTRHIFEFDLQPNVGAEEVIERILLDIAEPMQVQPAPISELNALYFSSPDGTFNVILERKSKVYFEKIGDALSIGEIDAIVNTYKLCNQHVAKANDELSELGLRVFRSEEGKRPTWEDMAGYETVRQEIQSTVIHALKHPEVYALIAAQTRHKAESNQPKAILFEGPPGTGKTTVARIIAGEIDVPMVYVPIEMIMSMYYGESEKLLTKVFDTCEKVGRSIVFIDEIDSLATSRGPNMHEATRRILSTLLRRIEGFDKKSGIIVIGATNRKEDLDDAMLSRFDISIEFPLPTARERESIFKLYAKQLSSKQLQQLGQASEGFSGRDIRDTCAHAERNWGTVLIEKMKVKKTESKSNTSSFFSSSSSSSTPSTPPPTPPFPQYLQSLKTRKGSIGKGRGMEDGRAIQA